MKTDNIRSEIDHIDSRIIRLLAKREELENQAAKSHIRKPGRSSERAIRKIKHKAAQKGIDPSVVERVFRGVIDEVSGGDDERYFPDI